MAAVISDKTKKQFLTDLLKDIQDSDSRYYIGIGRSEDWNDSDIPVTPENTLRDGRQLRLRVQSVKNITDTTFVVPRYNWVSGAVYSGYDDDQVGYPTNAYYVMNSNQEIYMCLQQGQTNANPPAAIASTVQPTGNTDGSPFRTSDGYIWKFLYSLGALKASKFLSSAYKPVQLVTFTDSDSPAEDVEQEAVQNAAIPGQVLGIRVTKGGAGYTSTPTVSIVGDGRGAQAAATVSGGAVTKITLIDSSNGQVAFGQDYRFAEIQISGGGGDSATARAIIGPPNGIGADPRDDLKSAAIMFNSKPSGTEDGTFLVNQDFRQVGLFKNLLYTDSVGIFTEPSALALKRLKVTSIADGPFTSDIVVQGATSNAKALIDAVDSSNLYYHQTEYTGFTEFDSGETISIVEGGGETTATIQKILKGIVDPLTGDLLYIDNRAAVFRSNDQTEDIKIVIQL